MIAENWASLLFSIRNKFPKMKDVKDYKIKQFLREYIQVKSYKIRPMSPKVSFSVLKKIEKSIAVKISYFLGNGIPMLFLDET